MTQWKVFIGLSFCWTAAFALVPAATFTSAEHVDLGDRVILYLSATDPGQSNMPLHLPNGLTLSYGELISFGDFYGDPAKAISRGKNPEEMNQRFLKAFNSFAVPRDVVAEAKQLISTVREEQQVIQSGLEQGLTEEETYRQQGDNYERRYNCLTGGGCLPATWWMSFGRYVRLANGNFDHFGNNALTAYRVGHALAMAKAVQAAQTNDLAELEIAYAMNAFACHFLSDRYAAGHMRTPRNELSHTVSPQILASLLTRFMHDEDNLYGLQVHNHRGDHWLAVGDKSYLATRSADHQSQQLMAMQLSADEVFSAYQQGVAPDQNLMDEYIPYPDEEGANSQYDIASLFYWDKATQRVMRRSNLTDRNTAQWTANWWSWSTLVKLANGKPLPIPEQARLAQSELAQKAANAGLISDPRILRFIKSS